MERLLSNLSRSLNRVLQIGIYLESTLRNPFQAGNSKDLDNDAKVWGHQARHTEGREHACSMAMEYSIISPWDFVLIENAKQYSP